MEEQQKHYEQSAQSMRNLMIDDHMGRDDETHTLFSRLIDSLRNQRNTLFLSTGIVVGWSCVCAYAAEQMFEIAAEYPGGTTEQWLGWLEEAGGKFRMIGILFVFAVVFRFNRCFDRWNQGRLYWGRIIAVSLDITRMASYWMVDDNKHYADHFSRFVIVLAYSCKALLRGNSLGDPAEEGQELVDKGYLTQEELDDMESNLGWQTHYCLETLGAVLVEAHYSPDSMMFDQSHKVHSQLFRAIDGNITQLNNAIGDAIRLRASGLPEQYDGLHHVLFYFYFIISPVFFAPAVGWVLPIQIGLESLLIMAIVVMGSDMIQPFGLDRVDLPLEFFCETIELQTQHIRERAKKGNIQRFARLSKQPKADNIRRVTKTSSMSRVIKGDHKKVDTDAHGSALAHSHHHKHPHQYYQASKARRALPKKGAPKTSTTTVPQTTALQDRARSNAPVKVGGDTSNDTLETPISSVPKKAASPTTSSAATTTTNPVMAANSKDTPETATFSSVLKELTFGLSS